MAITRKYWIIHDELAAKFGAIILPNHPQSHFEPGNVDSAGGSVTVTLELLALLVPLVPASSSSSLTW